MILVNQIHYKKPHGKIQVIITKQVSITKRGGGKLTIYRLFSIICPPLPATISPAKQIQYTEEVISSFGVTYDNRGCDKQPLNSVVILPCLRAESSSVQRNAVLLRYGRNHTSLPVCSPEKHQDAGKSALPTVDLR